MKLLASLIFLAISTCTFGQYGDLHERLAEILADHSITDAQLEKFEKIRSKSRWTDDKKQEKLHESLMDLGIDSFQISLVIRDLVNQNPQALSAIVTLDNWKGYPKAYLELLGQKMYDTKEITETEFSLLRSIITARMPEDPAEINQDVNTARERIKYKESEFYTLEDYETIRMFDWESYLDFKADLDVIQDQLRNIGGVTWDAFNTHMEQNGSGLGKASNLQQMFHLDGPACQTALAFEFMEEVNKWRSYCLRTEEHYKSSFQNSPYFWKDIDFVKYRDLIADPVIRQYLIQYMVIQHWYHRERKNFNDFNALGQELKNKHRVGNPWEYMEKVEWEVSNMILQRFGFRASNEKVINDLGKDPFMSILVMYRNNAPLIPDLSRNVLETLKSIDMDLLRLTDDEEEFLLMIDKLYQGNQILDDVLNHENFEQYHYSKKMRFAMLIQLIKIGLSSDREWFINRPNRLYWEELPEQIAVEQMEDGEARMQRLVEGKRQIRELLDSVRKGPGQYIIQYFPNSMTLYPAVSFAHYDSIQRILKDLFPESPYGLNFTRLSFRFSNDPIILKPEIQIHQTPKQVPDEELFPYESIEINEDRPPRPAVTPPPPPKIKSTSDVPPKPIVVAEIIPFPDVEASFPGGQEVMKNWIASNINYPEEALSAGVQGRVYVSFVVEPDGSLTNINIERGISKELDGEAKRLIRSMPKWTPGEAGGKKVRSQVRLPIDFILEKQ